MSACLDVCLAAACLIAWLPAKVNTESTHYKKKLTRLDPCPGEVLPQWIRRDQLSALMADHTESLDVQKNQVWQRRHGEPLGQGDLWVSGVMG